MSFKLILKNVKKNIQDYLIYFLTLMLTVSLFYSFNSIESQDAFKSLNATRGLLANQLGIFITVLSNIIAVVLAFLIIYANQFLLKRRKKELGIYMTLGMDKSKISRIFVGETFLIAIIALITGLALGFVLSQGLSLVALKLFAIDLSEYKIIFSIDALKKTIICFAIIFFIVMIFSVRTVSQVKLINMLMDSRKNESLNLQNKWFDKVLLFMSILVIGVAGYLVYKDGILPNSDSFNIIVVFMCIGTLLFFYSVSSVILEGVKANKSVYLKNLNTFLFRQLGSKIQSNFISMAVVCGLLTITICILSAGLSVSLTMNSHAKEAAPYDMTVVATINKTGDVDIYQEILNKEVPIDKYLEEYVEIADYSSNLKYKDIWDGNDVQLWKVDDKIPETPVPIISVSDFNKVMKLQGKEVVSLGEDEFLLNCNYQGTQSIMQEFVEQKGIVMLNGVTLRAKQSSILSETITMTSVDNNDRGTIIVSDSLIKHFNKDHIILSGLYKKSTNPDEVVNSLIKLTVDLESGFRYTTKSMMYDMYYGMQALVSFLCCYIGLIFLIICASLLALQQLTETADNIKRYELLRKLGADESLINKTLFKQVGIYFIAPFILASIFSTVAIKKVMELIIDFLNMNVSMNVIFTVIIFLITYVGYFIATYHSCKKMLSNTDI